MFIGAVQLYMSMGVAWPTLSEPVKRYAPAMAVAGPLFVMWAVWPFPSALCYYWTCSNLYSLGLDLGLRIPYGMFASAFCLH